MFARSAALLCILVPFSAGCAWTNTSVEEPIAVLMTSHEGGDARTVIVHIPFDDSRAITDRCGMKKNALNWDTADIACDFDPREMLARRLQGELRSAGFSVIEESQSRPDSLIIDGRLTRFFIEPIIGWTAAIETDIALELRVRTHRGLDASRSFLAKGVVEANFVTNAELQFSSDRAIQSVLDEMVAAILELHSRYPELG